MHVSGWREEKKAILFIDNVAKNLLKLISSFHSLVCSPPISLKLFDVNNSVLSLSVGKQCVWQRKILKNKARHQKDSLPPSLPADGENSRKAASSNQQVDKAAGDRTTY